MHKSLIVFIFITLPYFGISQEITLEDIWLKGKYRAEYFNSINWATDGKSYTEFSQNTPEQKASLKLYSVGSQTTKELLSLANFPENFLVTDYILSSDQKTILFSTDEEPIYRRSSVGNFYLYEISTGKLNPIHDLSKGKISYASFAPNQNDIAFVRQNNLFIVNCKTFTETQITFDGQFNFIINGATDWVYEEEFEFAKAFFWSPDSKNIVFYRFDETNVKQYTMQVWGENYPTDYRYKYPKAGEENATVELKLYSLETKKTTAIDQTQKGEKEYFPRVQWTGNPAVLGYYRMNRLQNKVELVHTNIQTNASSVVYSETDKAYIEIDDNLFYLSNSEEFVFTSEKNGYRQIYYSSKSSSSSLLITAGSFDVSEVYGIDTKKKRIYFSSQEDSPLEKQLYSINLDGTNKLKHTKESGTHTITFSPNFLYYVDHYSNINTPPSATLRETSKNKVVTILGDNNILKEKLTEIDVSTIEFFNFKTSMDTSINGWILKPKNFDASKKYPVLVTIYGGPGAQEVVNGWRGTNYFWFQLLADKGYIVLSVDGRGTGGRGTNFKKCTQYNLGKYESDDLIETAIYLKKQPYIDGDRIGIFGWSFGGYLSSLAITKGSDYFKSAIAVAPVTNWKYYDNIYTERYMGLPEDNKKGYDENAPTFYADKLKGNYLLIHGTADDNVHLQNSIEMERALINANKQFDMFYYPDKNHSIYGGNTRHHLYKMMTDFLLKKL